MKQKDGNTDGFRTDENSKIRDLEQLFGDAEGKHLTTNQGVQIGDNQNSLKAGNRGPTLMEDFIFREKMTHFDHERIPERVVHARGSGAHGYFQVYESLAKYTKAKFLQDPSMKTPVFVRFSTVVGFRGSADTVRDVRGFATKFYTADGNYDLVANNIPVFFIQDAIKFPDLVHAIKPEPHDEMPQASAAHDNFWDFISLMPESLHMIMWVLSDRALPRSYRMMDGFGVHTFKFINAEDKVTFVKFHWRPKLGVHSLVWDETQKIAGKDPDFNRRDLWEAIEMGNFPEYELCVQLFDEEQAAKFDFDHLDATKIIPEELIPIRRIGKMVLNKNPDNFFAETEQIAFHPGHIVPGIDFSNDPLLQGRLFSYLDTQLIRLGGPNFAQLPINRPVCPVHNNQQDGYMRFENGKGRVNYEPNSLGGGCPMQNPDKMRAFFSHAERIDAHKIRERSPSFSDHYSQATLFWNSMTDVEKEHIVEAAQFELGKVDTMAIRERMIEHFNKIDHEFAVRVAEGIGVQKPTAKTKNHGRSDRFLSINRNTRKGAETRKVAVLVENGFSAAELKVVKEALTAAGAKAKIVSKNGGMVRSAEGEEMKVDKTFVTTASVLFDAVYVPGGEESFQALKRNGKAVHFINESFRHCKPIAASGQGIELLRNSDIPVIDTADANGSSTTEVKGVVTAGAQSDLQAFAKSFIAAIAEHRHWNREMKDIVPA
ncbi:MAG: catalase [Limisphaerales bacterium]